ncbi:hypothetical protein D3C72_486940 [compost metagenome]
MSFAQGIPGPYRRKRRRLSMNQTESVCKAEGVGRGILCEEARYFRVKRRLRQRQAPAQVPPLYDGARHQPV